MTNGGSGSNNESRYSSLEADFGPDQSFISNASHVTIQDAGSNQEGEFFRSQHGLTW
jgi:regulatory factor X